MPRHDTFDTRTLLAIGISAVDGFAMPGRNEPGPVALEAASLRLDNRLYDRLLHVGWVSPSGHLYSDAQHEDLPHVSMVPVYRLLTKEG